MEPDILWGALIGAGGSILGGLLATWFSIWRQNKAAADKEKNEIKLSANILYNDSLNILKEMVHMNHNRPTSNLGYGSHNSQYSQHIGVLKGGLNADDQYSLHCLYGVIMKFQDLTQTEVPDNHKSAEYEASLNRLLERFCILVYENKENFERQTKALALTNFQLDHAKRSMRPEFQQLFDKLERLKMAP